MKKKNTPDPRYLTVRQYADKMGKHHNLIYRLIEDGTIVPDQTVISGKGFIEWDKYKDLVIGDRSTTMKRRIINRATEEITAKVLAELKK